MGGNSYLNIVNSFGLKNHGNLAIDVINAIPVKLYNNNGSASVFISNVPVEVFNNINSEAVSSGLRKGSYHKKTGGAMFFFNKPKLAYTQYETLRGIIGRNARFMTVDRCPYCGTNGCDVAGMHNNYAVAMHRSCYLTNRNHQVDAIRNEKGNYIPGILLSLVAAIALAIILALIVVSTEKVYFYLYIIYPFLVASAYRLGKGPHGGAGTLATILISILGIFAYFYFQMSYYAADTFGIGVLEAAQYVSDIISFILDPEFLKNCILEFVCFGIGIVVGAVYNPASKTLAIKGVAEGDNFIVPLYSGSGNTDNYNNNYNNYNYGGDASSSAYGNDVYGGSASYGDAYNGSSTGSTSGNSGNYGQDVYGNNVYDKDL